MAVTTYTNDHDIGFFSRIGIGISTAFARMLTAREAQAQRYIATALRNLDDDRLNELGLTRKEVDSRPHAPFIY